MPMPDPPLRPFTRRKKDFRKLNRKRQILTGKIRDRGNRLGRVKTPQQHWRDFQRLHQRVSLGTFQPYKPPNQNQLQAPPSGLPNP